MYRLLHSNALWFLILAPYANAWEQEFTTDIIQKYQAPVSLEQEVRKISFCGVRKCSMYFLKTNASRIIGVERLHKIFTQYPHDDFKTPQKYLIPAFNNRGRLNVKGSFVVSMPVENAQHVQNLSGVLITRLLTTAEKTGIWDFTQRNMLEDEEGVIWLIDTELLYQDKFIERAADAILQDHHLLKYNGYRFSETACISLINRVNNTYDKERYKSMLLKDQ